MATTPKKALAISREKLALFLPNPELIRLFEDLVSDVQTALPKDADEIRQIAEGARTIAELLQNRSYIVANAEGDLDSSRMLTAAGGVQIQDNFTPGTLRIRTINLLGALDALTNIGFLARTGATTASARTLTSTPRISITNGNGIGGNPEFDVIESALDLSAMGGLLPVSSGGTGAMTAGDARTNLGIDDINFATGDFKQRAALAFPSGWIRANTGTIGNASSGATRANADTLALFVLWWAFTDAQIPIQTSSGAASTRGASAISDFNANKRMTVPSVPDSGLLIGGYKL